jgi:hypothetical protein
MDDKLTMQELQQTLTDAGLEIYRAEDDELCIAERVRLHLMDSGVKVTGHSGVAVRFTARSQQSDAPSASPERLVQRVREHVGAAAKERGYEESLCESVEVKDPIDDSKVLDVWHEVTYEKTLTQPTEAVDEVRWALALDKYVRL